MEYCPQCGVRDPAGYNIQAPAVGQVEGRKRSNFLVPFLGIAAICRASSRVSSLAADRRPGSSSK